ncbi:MAG: hypothetical protein JWN45_2223 [Acidobacteriaceae bacterium]|nr:hypothetical protein [Acidobacteriaceae bacterium]
MKIALEFTPAQSPEHQSRLRYAFQLFCAVYGHEPILDSTKPDSADLRITYSGDYGTLQRGKVLRLQNGYRPRPLARPVPRPRCFREDGTTTVLFYPPENSAQVDWLAEVFEWISCADEYSICARDSVGRIPFESSVFGRYGLDGRIPYAALAMWFLQRAIRKLVPSAEEKAQAPGIGLTHAIVCSHDVDFMPLGYFSVLGRLLKNSIIALQQSPSVALGIFARAVLFALGGANPLQGGAQLARSEQKSGITSSFNFIVRHNHRRDANYRIENPAVIELMRWLQSTGMEIALHGSYTSLDTCNGLSEEFEILQKHGFQPLGGRQHWLRFSLDRLITAVERAGVLFDTSVGWQDHIGFRAGACFPFPPYNFAEERPARFLEIPLAVMDQALSPIAGEAFTAVAKLLASSRMYGWGGISLLWHPTAFGGGQLPIEIGRTFYDLVNARSEWQDTWLSARKFLQIVRHRYIEVGLMDRDWGASDQC